jgi:hypothetical protein
MSFCTTRTLPTRFPPPAHHSDRHFLHWTITDQDVAIAQRVICDFECQMPSVPSRALLVHDDSLLRVCPPGGTSCNNIIGVADIAGGHNNRPSRPAIFSGEDSYLPPSTYQRSITYALMTNVITANRAPASPRTSQSIFEPTMCHYDEKSRSGLC